MSSGEHVEIHSDPLKIVDELDNLLLHDSSKQILEHLKKSANENMIIGIVLLSLWQECRGVKLFICSRPVIFWLTLQPVAVCAK